MEIPGTGLQQRILIVDDDESFATAMGRVHSLVAVEIDWFASAFADYEEGILDLVGRPGAVVPIITSGGLQPATPGRRVGTGHPHGAGRTALRK